MDCIVDSDGNLRACAVVSESPTGRGFGESVVQMQPLFHVRTPVSKCEQQTCASARILVAMDGAD